MKNRLFFIDENSSVHQFDFMTENDANKCKKLLETYMNQTRILKNLSKKLADCLALGSGICDVDISQRDENGVSFLETSHSSNCRRCSLLREYNEKS